MAKKRGYTGHLPSLHVEKTTQQVINDTCQWGGWITSDNRFHYGYTGPNKKPNAHHNGCYFCGTNGRQKAGMLDPQFTYCCNPFVHACWSHGGLVPAMLKICKKGSSYDFQKGQGYDKSKLFTNLGKPSKGSLKKGDVLCNNHHVALYIGSGKIVEASGGDDNKRNSKKWNNSIHITTLTDSRYKSFLRVHRFNSSINCDHNIVLGDISDDVAKLQEFLKWYTGDNLTADRICGDKTVYAIKKFQKAEGLTADGIFGPGCLKKAIECQQPAEQGYPGAFPDFAKLTIDMFVLKAKQFSWALGTAPAKRNYKTGSRRPAYTDALYKAFPKYKGGSEAYKKGASCSVFIATIVRDTTLDPHYLPSKTLYYMQSRPDLWKRQTQSSARAGDVFFYWHNEAKNDYHILMYGGKVGGKYLWYQANAGKQYPYAFYGSAPTASKYNKAFIYRPIKAVRNYIQFGDTGIQGGNLQGFLNWYGGYGLVVDGGIGQKSVDAIKDFQAKEGLVVDGKFGVKCLERAKQIRK